MAPLRLDSLFKLNGLQRCGLPEGVRHMDFYPLPLGHGLFSTMERHPLHFSVEFMAPSSSFGLEDLSRFCQILCRNLLKVERMFSERGLRAFAPVLLFAAAS